MADTERNIVHFTQPIELTVVRRGGGVVLEWSVVLISI